MLGTRQFVIRKRKAKSKAVSHLAGGGGGGGWSCCQATPRDGSLGVCSVGVDGVDGELAADEPGFFSADLSGLALNDGSFGPLARTQPALKLKKKIKKK